MREALKIFSSKKNESLKFHALNTRYSWIFSCKWSHRVNNRKTHSLRKKAHNKQRDELVWNWKNFKVIEVKEKSLNQCQSELSKTALTVSTHFLKRKLKIGFRVYEPISHASPTFRSHYHQPIYEKEKVSFSLLCTDKFENN